MAHMFPTHALLGLSVAQALAMSGVAQVESSHPVLLLYTAGMLGCMVPDVPEYFWEKYIKKTKPMAQEGPVIMFFKEVTNSYLCWGVVYLLWILLYPEGDVQKFGHVLIFSAMFAGVTLNFHTHSEERFLKTDPTFIYPLSLVTTKRLRSDKQEWEYRKGDGDLGMKDCENNLIYRIIVYTIYITLFFSLFGTL